MSVKIFDIIPVGDSDDQYQAAKMLQDLGRGEDDAYVHRLRRQAGNLVRRHRVTIERVAVALVARHRLAEEDIEALMRAAGLRPLAA